MDVSNYILPILILITVLIALFRKINAYSSFVEGSKEGLHLYYSIYPAMLAMMFAITLLRESGLMTLIADTISNFITFIPASIWPMVLFRPISGSASLAVLVDIFKSAGVDSFVATMASIIQGSTDTTVYVITLYFSTVGIKKIKNALAIGLIADVAGIGAAILLTIAFFS